MTAHTPITPALYAYSLIRLALILWGLTAFLLAGGVLAMVTE